MFMFVIIASPLLLTLHNTQVCCTLTQSMRLQRCIHAAFRAFLDELVSYDVLTKQHQRGMTISQSIMVCVGYETTNVNSKS